jgi:predicted RNA-binding Zn ribbon-like protein
VIFAHDTEQALSAAVALVNTRANPDGTAVDALTSIAGLRDYLDAWQWTGSRAGDAAELSAVRALRQRLADIWTADEDAAVLIVNELLSGAGALPQLVRHNDWGYHVHATSLDAPLADRIAVEATMAMTDVIRMKELARLRECAADDCGHVLVDLSKNRSRRYCDSGCGNRVNVAAYRARLGRG